jgi:redox-sensitive bicupin YhaK (pirin superfamily)
MRPSDLGERLKPFVFLDLFEADMRALAGSMPVHPHSGIETVTVFTDGDVTFDDPTAGRGRLGYGGVEAVRAGRGMWHGKELSTGASRTVQGFQLWIALPPEMENTEPEAQYVGADQVPTVGPAHFIVGAYRRATSPVRAPHDINCLLVTLTDGERWVYDPPPDHLVRWVALAKGALAAVERISEGELVIFERSDASISFVGAGSAGATLVLGSAVLSPYELHLGAYSVHTSEDALAVGERYIRRLKQRLDAAGDRRTGSGSTPVFRQ